MGNMLGPEIGYSELARVSSDPIVGLTTSAEIYGAALFVHVVSSSKEKYSTLR